MFSWLKRLWNWITRWFQPPEPAPPPPPEPSNLDWENHLLALLEEVERGKSWAQLQVFLMMRDIDKNRLAQWLRGFGERLAAQEEPDRELVRRLERLAGVAQGELGIAARNTRARLSSRRRQEPEDVRESTEEVAPTGLGGDAVREEGVTGDRVEDTEPDAMQEAEDWFDRGNQKFMVGDFVGAIASFDAALKVKPDKHEAWYNRGVSLDNLGRFEEAIASYDAALKIKPDKHEAWNNRGNSLYNLGRFEEAIASYDAALKVKPDKHEAWYNRGVSLDNLGRIEEAIASYDAALKIKPDKHEAWNNRGNSLYNLGRFEEAIASYDAALKVKPDKHEAWNNRGVSLDKLGRFEEAIASYDAALKIKPDDHEAWYNRGVSLGKLGRFEEAIASYDAALKIKPDKHEAWNNRGNSLYNLGRFEEAIASYDAALKVKPDDHEAWVNRGNSLDNLGRFEEAIASYDAALKIKPDKHEAWNNRGVSLGKLGRFEEAIASYDAALKIKPDKHEAWNNRGNSLGKLGRIEEAIASYDAALKVKPDKHEAWYNRGVSLDNLGRFEEAIASYDAALKIKPDSHLAWINRSIAAANSTAHDPYYQQQFIALFRDSLRKSKQLLVQSLAEQDILPSDPEKLAQLRAFIEQPLSDAAAHQIYLNSLQHPSLFNPQLNQRGYPGQLASLQAELNKAIRRDTHPEGWGMLHRNIGRAYYSQARQVPHPHSFRRQAETSYKTALQTLTPREFPELHLEVLIDLIKVLLDLGETNEAKVLQQDGSSLLQRLLAEPQRPERSKTQLARQFAPFQQFTVDLAVQSGDLCAALSLAEAAKNTCLRWLLALEEIPQIAYAQIQNLLTSPPTKTEEIRAAILYWHLSPNALTTFLILPEEPEPILIAPPTQLVESGLVAEAKSGNPFANNSLTSPLLRETGGEATTEASEEDLRSPSLLQVLALESWIEKWNRQDGDSKTKGKPTSKTGRNTLSNLLNDLGIILNIPAIEQYFQNSNAANDPPQSRSPLTPLEKGGNPLTRATPNLPNPNRLILIPHRDLHRVPLHVFFESCLCTYLPSAYLGLRQSPEVSPLDRTNASNSDCASNSSPHPPVSPSPRLPVPPDSLLLVENPKSTPKNDGKTKPLSDLPFAEIESALIRQLFSRNTSPITRIEGENATQTQLQQTLQQPHRIFHFSGHAAYNHTTPTQSCLFLTDADRLTAQTLIKLDLSPYRLISLAACETAVTGNQTITDEYVGLVSAFLKAGAFCIISTLWKVESAASALLMVEFYRQLLASQSPAVALKTAQTWLCSATREDLLRWWDWAIDLLREDLDNCPTLQNRKKKIAQLDKQAQPYNNPYYWAAFTVAGRW